MLCIAYPLSAALENCSMGWARKGRDFLFTGKKMERGKKLKLDTLITGEGHTTSNVQHGLIEVAMCLQEDGPRSANQKLFLGVYRECRLPCSCL